MIRFLKPASTSPVVERFRAAIDDAELGGLLESWLKLAKDQPLPDKSRFDPLDHRSLLPRMWIYELTPDRSDFVGRLSGEQIRHVWGQTTKGLRLSQISSPDRFRPGLRRWLYCVTAPAVLLGKSTEGSQYVVKRLSLPFTDSEGRLYVLGASQYAFGLIDPFEARHPFRFSQTAIAARAADLIGAAHGAPDSHGPAGGVSDADRPPGSSTAQAAQA